ncbi:MAG: aminopeptidase [Elusimicrobiota bacterium]
MADIRLQRLAQVLVDYSFAIKKGDLFAIQGGAESQPLMKEVFRLAVKKGAHVEIYPALPEIKPIFLKNAGAEQLKWVPLQVRSLLADYDKNMTVFGSSNTKELSNVPAAKLKDSMLAVKKLREKFFQRMAEGKVHWCGTAFPSNALAQEAGMSLEEYEDFVYGACLCDKKNPVARWQAISRKQQKIAKFLNRIKEIHIVAPGTDIRASVKGRKWENCDGRMNFPDGEVFTGPVENSVNGHIRFSFPGIYMDREIEDIRLEFKNGKVVNATAAKGEDLLRQLLETDPGAKYVGELAIGTNYGIQAFTRNMLFDEKIGGTVHLAVGAGFPETGSKNKSTLHWDMLCDMRQNGRIYGDGRLIYKNGKFTRKF